MTTAAHQPARARSGVLARYPLTSFFVLAYLLTWLVWSPWVFGRDGAGWLPTSIDPALVGYLNAFAILMGPTVAALVVTAACEGGAGVRRLLARVVRWRVGWMWYLVALVAVPVLAVLGCVVYSGTLPDVAAIGGPAFLLSYVPSFLLVAVLGGPLFEEIGWRGFALPRLQRRMAPAAAALVLGLLWTFWHLPQFFSPSWAEASGGGGPIGIALYTLTVLSFSVVISWIFNNTRASVLIAILVHTSIDAVSTLLPPMFPPGVGSSAVPVIIAFGGAALVLLAVTRGRLGIGRLRAEDA
ncbi:CPBP family intramembrane glutamic endopeptidase [Actinomycetospora flava]|uniref:Type II CAAX endopeptidase family protein n=1 Tax=Actinomycetospora flava TaxID=3129232 RepID=A0ABU8MDF1_9PSEU